METKISIRYSVPVAVWKGGKINQYVKKNEILQQWLQYWVRISACSPSTTIWWPRFTHHVDHLQATWPAPKGARESVDTPQNVTKVEWAWERENPE